MSPPRLLVLSGMSGSGKSSALRSLEDLSFYCVDNLPPPLIPTFLDLCERAVPPVSQIAVAVDVRARDFLERFEPLWESIRARLPESRLVFVDAEDAVLVQRFSETRRPHPLTPRGSVTDGISVERGLLSPLRELADDVIDTSHFTVHELRSFLQERFGGVGRAGLNISVASFGYRNGILDNADLVFDVRFVPNPHYDPKLRPLTGLDVPVREFVEQRQEVGEFLERLDEMLRFLLPQYDAEGKAYLTIALGCTGGRHRSVAIAEMLAERLREQGHQIRVTHADLGGPQSRRPGLR